MAYDAPRFAASNIHYFYYPVEHAFEHIAKAGYGNLEFFAGTPHFFADATGYSNCKKIARLAAETGLTILALHPETVSKRHTLCHADPAWRARSADCFRRSMDAAKELGARIVPIEAVGMFLDEPREDVFKRCVENLAALSGYAAELDLTLALENTGADSPGCMDSFESVCAALRSVGSPNLKALLSIPAMAEVGETIPQWFAALGGDIAFVHLNDGRPGGRYVWGQGVLPLERFLRQLDAARYAGPLGQYLDGDQYLDDPAQADAQNMLALQRAVPEGGAL